jgi:photosystem II stability/assembly factor-like uncharacterized protein
MPIQTRISALLGLAILGLGSAVASAQTAEQPDDTVWQVVASGNELRAVFFLEDGKRGWVVGSSGMILATRDGGEHWTPQASSTSDSLYGVAFADRQHGWAVGQDGIILSTTDGGGSWKKIAGKPTSPDLQSVASSADGKLGWAVGANNTILKTTDHGTNWKPPEVTPLPVSSILFYGVAFPNERRGWVVGSKGTILVTTDGGDSWQKQQSYTDENLKSVAFADGQRGWAVGDKGTILGTVDGGDHWLAQTSHTSEDLYAVAFGPDKRSGWAVGDNGTILGTANGGKTWESQKRSTSKTIYGVSVYQDLKRGWVVGADGTVLTTTSVFGTWTPQRSSTIEVLDGVALADDGKRGWAVSAKGSILGTEDGGKNWTVQYTPAPEAREELNGIAFAGDGVHGWAVGDKRPRLQNPSLPVQLQGVILTTANGAKWEPATQTAVPERLTSVAVSSDGQRAWAVGYNGTVLASHNVGKWDEQKIGTEDLFSVAFDPGGHHGLAVGSKGTVLATVDGGHEWQQKDSSPPFNPKNVYFTLRSVAFAGERHGWAVGDLGNITYTTDWGDNWELPENPATSSNLSGIAATANQVWAVGDGGTILTTRRYGKGGYGKAWEKQTSLSSADLYAIAISADGSGGWAAGANGTVLVPVKRPRADIDSIKNALSVSATMTSFQVHSNPWMPVWSAYLEVKKNNEDWRPLSPRVGPAKEVAGDEWQSTWQITWDPVEHGFNPGDQIYQRIQINAGGISLQYASKAVSYTIPWPWWRWVWRDYRGPIIAALFGVTVFILSNVYYFVLFLFAPAQLAQARPWPDWFPPPLSWPSIRNILIIVLSLLSRTQRVCRAWKKKFTAGRRILDDLNEFARKPLVNDPEVLDTWVAAHMTSVYRALGALALYNERRTYVPAPVRVVEIGAVETGAVREVDPPDPMMLREIFSRLPAVVCIIGGESSGKSTLACAIARWAMAEDPTQRLASHRMIPVLIVQDITDLRVAVIGRLVAMTHEKMPDDLIDGLLKQQRLCVIIDGLSERNPDTQQCVENIFKQLVIPNALVITSRTEPKLDVRRTLLRRGRGLVRAS